MDREEKETLRKGAIVAAVPSIGRLGYCRLCRAQWQKEERHLGDCPAREENRKREEMQRNRNEN